MLLPPPPPQAISRRQESPINSEYLLCILSPIDSHAECSKLGAAKNSGLLQINIELISFSGAEMLGPNPSNSLMRCERWVDQPKRESSLPKGMINKPQVGDLEVTWVKPEQWYCIAQHPMRCPRVAAPGMKLSIVSGQ